MTLPQAGRSTGGEFWRVLAFLDAQGIGFCDRDGDPVYLRGHTFRRIAERYVEAQCQKHELAPKTGKGPS